MKNIKILLSVVFISALIIGFTWNSANATASNFARVSITSSGVEGNDDATDVSISGDGRYIAFSSEASNLVSGDTNAVIDVFVRDTVNNTTTRVSTDSNGAEGNNTSHAGSISYNGRYVAFVSYATNLITGDTNGKRDVFVKDLQTGNISVSSITSGGTLSNGYNDEPSISADGRHIVFSSDASNLVSGLSSPYRKQIYIKDLATGAIKLLSAHANGTVANNSNYNPKISCDGGIVTYSSDATNLVDNDTNVKRDVFVQHLGGDTNSLANITLAANNDSVKPNISCNGNAITFYSAATNLIGSDTNGVKDVFLYNRVNVSTSIVSVASNGTQGNGEVDERVLGISGNGRFITFGSYASNLDAADNNSSNTPDLFIRDTKNNVTELVSYKLGGGSAGLAWDSGLSEDGSKVTYLSSSAYVVANDNNFATDVFTANTGF